MLISPKVLLADAEKHNYAVPAFNFYNLDTVAAIVAAAEDLQSPIIAQIYFSHFTHYDGGASIAAAALELIQESPMPIALHLDHSTSYAAILHAIRCGFNSVMIDGSALSLEDNIAITSKVTEIGRALDVYTEAELGRIIRIGKDSCEDDNEYINVEDAKRLVAETKVDSLAPAVGTAHGIYKKEPQIQFELLKELAETVKVPLVLHGGSGIPDEMILKSIDCGIRKINVGTELKYAWDKAVGEAINAGEKEIIAISKIATESVYQVACRKITLFGSANRAKDIISGIVPENS